ncbi:MAG: hypothetical protein M3446_07820 [Actinomycetota bacterium]|nr:hypothetical protein [Actinomycetota bacterium]
MTERPEADKGAVARHAATPRAGGAGSEPGAAADGVAGQPRDGNRDAEPQPDAGRQLPVLADDIPAEAEGERPPRTLSGRFGLAVSIVAALVSVYAL